MHSVRCIRIDRNNRHALVPVIRGELFDALLIHLRHRTVIAGKDNGQDFGRSVLLQAVVFTIYSRQVEIRRSGPNRQYWRSIGRLGGDIILGLSPAQREKQCRGSSEKADRKTAGGPDQFRVTSKKNS